MVRCLNIIPIGVLLQRDKVPNVLIDVAEPPLYSLDMLNKLPEGSFRLFLEASGSIGLNGSIYVGNQL